MKIDNVFEAANNYLGQPSGSIMSGNYLVGAFLAGAAWGATQGVMSREEILAAIKQALGK